jgi:hypothetical protein
MTEELPRGLTRRGALDRGNPVYLAGERIIDAQVENTA